MKHFRLLSSLPFYLVLSSFFIFCVSVYAQDENKILFTSDQDGNREIYTMNSDGSDIQRLTTDDGEDTEPTWSPDHSQIAFASNRTGNFAVYIMKADGKQVKQVTPDNGSSYVSSPSWSPDGGRIAYVATTTGTIQIHTIAVDGTDDQQLTQGQFDSVDPAWSPNGKWIAFAANPNGNYEVYVMLPNGTGAQQLTSDSSVDSDSPAWSPDAHQIVFSANGGSGEIYIMDANGDNLRLLTSTDEFFASSPSWSPDGKAITYVFRGKRNKVPIRLIDAEGFSARQLTDGTNFTDYPSWAAPSPVDGGDVPTISTGAEDGVDNNGEVHLAIGNKVQIASLEPAIALRAQPSIRAKIIRNVARSETVTIIDGPQFVSEQSNKGVPQDFNWWQIQLESGEKGWMPESTYGEPILVLASALNPITPVTCQLTTLRGVNIRNGAGSEFEQVASRTGSQILAADGQAIGSDSKIWWRLYKGFWVRSDFVTEKGDCNNLPSVPSN